MAKLLTVLIFSTILNSFLITFALSKKHSLNEVINVLANMVDYFKKNYQSLNFEAHFGLRVVEGQLKLLLSEYNEGKHRSIPANVMTQLRYLSGEAAKTANMAVPHLLEYDRRAFTWMRYQVEKPWLASHNHRLINTHSTLNVPANAHKPKEILEDDRNICGAELTGTNNQDGHKCATTLNCLQTMSAKGQRGFSLQHQIFYTALAEQVGCVSAVDDYLASLTPKTNLEQLQRELCTNAYYELLKTVEFYGIQPSFANLFLLIEFNCPSLGFFQFLTDEWLDLILTWQNSNGCISGANDQVTEVVNKKYKKLPSRLIVQQEEPIKQEREIQHEIYKQNFNPLKHSQQDDTNSQVVNSQRDMSANDQFENQENANSPVLHDSNNFPQQNAWFPIPNPHFANVDYENSVHTQDKIANIANQFHQRLRISGADEIAHAPVNVLRNNQNDVHEVIHSSVNNNPLVISNHNRDIPLNHENGKIKTFKRRSLLEIQKPSNQKVEEDDDHGYFFDREKHIGSNSSEQRVYMYQYPIHDQMKRMMEFKERQELRKAERQRSQHSQHSTTRKLLKDTTGNCNVQLTGLAACALTMYVRFMVDPGPPEFHNLRLNKPEGQYDVGAKESEENDPDEPLFVPNKQRNLAINDQSVDKLYPLRGGFQPLYFGDLRKKLHPEEDDEYVRKAEMPKNLIDKAFDSRVRTFGDPKKNISNIHGKKVIEKENKTKTTTTTTRKFISAYFAKSGRISEFNKNLPTELGHHLILIVVISLVCVVVLFRYFRLKRRVHYRTKYI